MAFVAIATGTVIEGHLPRNAARPVKEWTLLHRGELVEIWRRVEQDLPPLRIEALDGRKS